MMNAKKQKVTEVKMSKVVFTPISKDELKPLITFAFEDDPDLLSKYSLLDNPTLEQSVDKNYQTILDGFANPVYMHGDDIKVYRLDLVGADREMAIGFTVTVTNGDAPHELFSFGININFRNRKIVMQWLDGVRKLLGKYYYVALHKNNTRAISFFVRNGLTPTSQEHIDIVTLISNFKDLVKLKSKSVVYGS